MMVVKTLLRKSSTHLYIISSIYCFNSGVVNIAIYSIALTKFTKKTTFLRKTIQQSFIETLSKKNVSFKNRSTD